MLATNPWVCNFDPRPAAAMQLVCFPHAGSAAATFGRWHEYMPPEIEVIAIEYPGRGSRRGERPFVRMHALVAALVMSAVSTWTRPFALFGHCMGGLVAFELARRLRAQGGR